MSNAAEYQVIARKWRPQKFADVVGQGHLTKTLRNAITQGRTAHAYLFVGPRGIGKTSTARIFAKALNCTNPNQGEPCCECDSCVAIAQERSIDIIEIDAASQNSVDNIRDLRDEVMHVPVNSRYKVYIIDEVHMLSKNAWNALLKTVEEPPPHVKFLFATTEAHKVLPTIVSRCQRFDLRRIPTKLIAERLNQIASAEGVSISAKAVEAIARAADGGMRDAQSLMDQMISFFGSDGAEEIAEEQVLSLFGLTALAEMEQLTRAILANSPAAVIAYLHKLSMQGKNLESLFAELLVMLRGIQVCQLMSDPELILEAGAETVAMYTELGRSVNAGIVQRLLEVLSPVSHTLHNALNKQVFLETIVLKAMRYAHAVQIQDLVDRLNLIRNAGELTVLDKVPEVEQHGGNPAQVSIESIVGKVAEEESTPLPMPTPPQAHSVPQSKPLVESSTSSDDAGADSATEENSSLAAVEQPMQPAEERGAPSIDETEAPNRAAEMEVQISPEEPAPTIATTLPSSLEDTQPSVSETETEITATTESGSPNEEPVSEVAFGYEEDRTEPASTVAAASDGATADLDTSPSPGDIVDDVYTEPVAELEMVAEEEPEDLGRSEDAVFAAEEQSITAEKVFHWQQKKPDQLWHELIEAVGHRNPIIQTYMQEGVAREFNESALVVVFDQEFEPEHIKQLKKEILLVNRVFQSICRDPEAIVEIRIDEGVASHHQGVDANDSEYIKLRKRVEGNQYVQSVMDLFDGDIVDIHG